MKKTFVIVLLTSVFLVSGNIVSGQKVAIISGNLGFLKGEKQLNIEYDYSSLRVGKKAENDYIEEKVKEKNEKKDGDGEKWLESWNRDKSERFPRGFETLLNEGLNKKGITASADGKRAKYTMIVKTTRIEPGWNVGISSSEAFVDVEIWFVETANPAVVLAKISILKSPGRTFAGTDFDTGQRITEAYKKCGKTLAAFLLKKAFK